MRNHLLAFALSSFTLVSAFTSASAVSAPEHAIKPGLWEVTTTSNLLSLASQIPPDQMENINAMAKEYGFEMPPIENGAAKTNACMTQEMANQKILPSALQTQAGCTIKNITQNGNAYRMDYVCKNQQLDGSGVAAGTFTNTENFTGKTVFNGTVQGSPITEQANVIGKWVASSCGNVKPLQ